MLTKLLTIAAAAKQLPLRTIHQSCRARSTVNFFQRRTGDVLWNTVTSISKHGVRKGQAKKRQPLRHQTNFYRIGGIRSNPIGMRYPGLSERVPDRLEKTTGEDDPLYMVEQTDEEREAIHRYAQEQIAKRPGFKNKPRRKEKLSPWERGFSGGTWLGQNLGPPPPTADGTNFDDFKCICFQTNMLSRMRPSFGRQSFFRFVIFIGNGKGVGGYALARSLPSNRMEGMAHAIRMASRRLFYIQRFEDRTIFQDFFGEYRNTRVFARRQEAGFGVIAHPRIRKICELLGLKDIYVRVEGTTNNYIAVVHAFMTGLINQESFQQVADRTRLKVVELNPNRMYYPEVVAVPMNAPIKSDEEVEPNERMRLERFWGESRFPYHYGTKHWDKLEEIGGGGPRFKDSIEHMHAIWKRHPYRNMTKKIIRMLADGDVKRWTRRERFRWAQRLEKQVEDGLKPLPLGIGLSDWVPMEEADERNVFLGNPEEFSAAAGEGDEHEDGELEMATEEA